VIGVNSYCNKAGPFTMETLRHGRRDRVIARNRVIGRAKR
jgi:hypothetical protein